MKSKYFCCLDLVWHSRSWIIYLYIHAYICISTYGLEKSYRADTILFGLTFSFLLPLMPCTLVTLARWFLIVFLIPSCICNLLWKIILFSLKWEFLVHWNCRLVQDGAQHQTQTTFSVQKNFHRQIHDLIDAISERWQNTLLSPILLPLCTPENICLDSLSELPTTMHTSWKRARKKLKLVQLFVVKSGTENPLCIWHYPTQDSMSRFYPPKIS